MSGLVPASAVDAMARHYVERVGVAPNTDWMRDLLEAAAPYMLAEAKADALREAAELIAPFSGIGMANGATRGDVSRWLRERADMFRPTK